MFYFVKECAMAIKNPVITLLHKDHAVNCAIWLLIPENMLRSCLIPITVYQYSRTRRWRKFQKGKIYNAEEHVAIESFVTTLIHWTFFSDDANKVGICWLCRSGQLHVTPSSRWSLPRCHRSVRNDMRLFLRTKQYPVQLRTTKYYSRRYYSSTTKYYSSTKKY